MVDEAATGHAREATEAARRAEFAVPEAVRELDSGGVVEAGGYGSLERLVQDLRRSTWARRA